MGHFIGGWHFGACHARSAEAEGAKKAARQAAMRRILVMFRSVSEGKAE